MICPTSVCPICHQKIPDDRLAQHIAFHEKYDQGIKKQATSDNQAMSANITATLNTRFGLATFRLGQAEAIQNLLAGQNTLVVMPTGAGKSLVYQLASLHRSGLTLIISPLIALMQDQVASLTSRGIPATYINSTLRAGEQNRRLRAMAAGDFQLVYVAPERLRNVPFQAVLRQVEVGLLAVDEAHCISQWGHDFRPDYRHIAEARPMMGNPVTVALTATATPKVQDDIVQALGLTSVQRFVTRTTEGYAHPCPETGQRGRSLCSRGAGAW